MSILDDIAEKIQSLLSDEESMKQIQELAAMFSSGGSTGENGSAPAAEEGAQSGQGGGLPDFNPLAIMQLIGAASAQDKNCDLLMALRPHLSPEKQQKLDKAVKLLKLYNIFITMRENGMLNDFEKML